MQSNAAQNTHLQDTILHTDADSNNNNQQEDIDQNTENESSENDRKVVEESPKGRFQRSEELLGFGSQKKVYLAYDTDTGREVAWNAVAVNIMNEDSIKKIKAEIEILKPLKHPNIITFIYGFYNDKKKEIVFITELFSGGSLKSYLLEFKNPRLRVVKLWCQEILKGLKYLHDSQIIHRDIKCENIFINRNTGEVKIGDLGLSIILKEKEYAKQFCGTIEFCAPEVYQGKYGVKADIYSFGMSMLEMITGEKPYEECKGQIMVICDKLKHKILPLCLNKIKNEKVYQFIIKCLRPEEERPSAGELLEDDFLNDLDSDDNNYSAISNQEINKSKSTQNKQTKNTTFSEIDINDVKNNDENLTKVASCNIKNSINDIQIDNIVESNISLAKNESKDNWDIQSLNMNDYLSNADSGELHLDSSISIKKISIEKGTNTNNNINLSDFSFSNENNITATNNDNNNLDNITFMNDDKEKSNMDICKIILIKKEGNKITKLKFNYIFSLDTVQGVVNELTKVIDMTNDEIKECEEKLNKYLNQMKSQLEKNYNIDEQIYLVNNCFELFNKEYNENVKQIQELGVLYQEIKNNEKEYKKEDIEDIDKKMKILMQIK